MIFDKKKAAGALTPTAKIHQTCRGGESASIVGIPLQGRKLTPIVSDWLVGIEHTAKYVQRPVRPCWFCGKSTRLSWPLLSAGRWILSAEIVACRGCIETLGATCDYCDLGTAQGDFCGACDGHFFAVDASLAVRLLIDKALKARTVAYTVAREALHRIAQINEINELELEEWAAWAVEDDLLAGELQDEGVQYWPVRVGDAA